MSEVVYTLATEADINALVTSRIAFLTRLMGAQEMAATQLLHDHLDAYFRRAVPSKDYIGVVAKSDGKIVATGGMVFREQPGSFKNPSGKTAYILNMYTIPDFRRRGISTNILNQLMEIATGMGIQSFELHATGDGEPVYQKCGFHKHHEPTYRKHNLSPALKGKVI